jgi:hypothetical protein
VANTKTSDETAAATLDGSELVRIVQSGGDVRTTTQDIADLGGGGGGAGLFNQILSATPTIASTGLSTWLNQGGASVADVATGMSLTAPSNSNSTILRGRTKSSPSTPYTITALLAANAVDVNYSWTGLGWYDGSAKLHVLEWYRSLSGAWALDVRQWANTTSAGSVETGSSTTLAYGMIPWVRLADDGTNVTFSFSIDGSNFMTLFTVAKASGYLGSSGYSNIVLFTNAQTPSTPVIATIMSWTQA